jgi:NADPH2:quinone reductase
MKGVLIEKPGGPEVLKATELPAPSPKDGEAIVRTEAIGVNFIDVYHRAGLYPLKYPAVPGMEGAGTVVAIGPGVSEATIGERVGWAMATGSYAELVAVPAWRLVRLPAGLDTRRAAAVMLQGMTAHYLSHSVYPLKPGDTALVHAAAGGVGLLLVQMAKRRGARVLATVSTEEKAHLAREAGADAVILYTRQDFEAEARRLTDGKGVQVVYDSVGKDTFMKSLGALARRGVLASFGQSSGAVPPFDPLLLSQKGSPFLTRPTLADYAATRDELLARAGDVLGWVEKGELAVRVETVLPLERAADAHRLLEGRKTTGKLLLHP